MRQLRLFPEAGNEYSVRLVNKPDSFVELCGDADVYPPEVWAEPARHVDALHSAGTRLPGGRYACAKALASGAVPCLQGLSLGRMCHIVQVAISHQKILGYRDGFLVPFHLSEDCAKERYALKQQPVDQP